MELIDHHPSFRQEALSHINGNNSSSQQDQDQYSTRRYRKTEEGASHSKRLFKEKLYQGSISIPFD